MTERTALLIATAVIWVGGIVGAAVMYFGFDGDYSIFSPALLVLAIVAGLSNHRVRTN